MLSFISSETALAFLLACAIKASVLLASAWFFVSIFTKLSAAQKHQLWAASILASLALPVFVVALPAWHSAVLAGAAALWSFPHGAAAAPASPELSSMNVTAVQAPLFRGWQLVPLGVWLAGVLFIALRFAGGLARLAWTSARSKPLFDDAWMRDVLALSPSFRVGRPVRLLLCGNAQAMPLTWGVFRPVIILPSGADQWTADRRRIVLSHELAHIARNDWLLQISAELARALHWFNPLVWLAAACLRRESERACDQAELNSGIAPSTYASQLLDLARTLETSGRTWSTALAIARPSNLERRFAAMLNPSIDRRHLSLRAKMFVPLFVLCLLLPLAALRLAAQNLAGKTSGSVHDPSGAGIANATIIMTHHAANVSDMTIDMTISDRDGNYVFNALPAGTYELQVLRPGFKPYSAQVSLDAGHDLVERGITLGVGAITEHVMVVPEDPTKAAPTDTASHPAVYNGKTYEYQGKPSRIMIGGNLEAAKLITKVQPVYPQSAKSAGVEGTVVLHAVIGMDGKPLSLRVMDAQIDPDLARSAVEAVSQWRYTPTLLNGEPIEVDTTISVTYSLDH